MQAAKIIFNRENPEELNMMREKRWKVTGCRSQVSSLRLQGEAGFMADCRQPFGFLMSDLLMSDFEIYLPGRTGLVPGVYVRIVSRVSRIGAAIAKGDTLPMFWEVYGF